MRMNAENLRQTNEVAKRSSHQTEIGWMSQILMKNKAMLLWLSLKLLLPLWKRYLKMLIILTLTIYLELKSFLKSLHISFKSQSLENVRFIKEMTELKKRNKFLESELVCLTEIEKECVKAKHIQSHLTSQCESIMNDLKKERDIIRVWTKSGRTTHKVQYDNKWKEGLGYSGDAKQEEVFEGMTPLNIPVNFVNYKPTSSLK